MASRLPSLNALKAFEAAARHGSFQKAANELNVTPSALSYQIRQLEEQLGTALFQRLNRKVVLTEAGTALEPGVRDAFARLGAAVARLRPDTPANVLTVSTGPSFAAKWLAPRVHRFIESCPDIELRISASLKLVDLKADGIDCVVRFGAGDYPGLMCERLFDEMVVPLASPALVRRFRPAMRPAHLAEVSLIHDDSATFLPDAANWAQWLAAEGVTGVDAARGPRFNHADHAIDAAIDGAGVVLARISLALRDVAAGRLVAPFGRMLPAAAAFHFGCLPEARHVEKIVRFRRFLAEEMSREAAALAAFRRALEAREGSGAPGQGG